MKRKWLPISLLLVLLTGITGCLGDPLADIHTGNMWPGTANSYTIGSEDLTYGEGWFEELHATGNTTTENILPNTANTSNIGSALLPYEYGYFTFIVSDNITGNVTANWDTMLNKPDVVVGTPPSTDHAIARYDGVTGLLIQDSPRVTIDDADNLTVYNDIDSTTGDINAGNDVNVTNDADIGGDLDVTGATTLSDIVYFVGPYSRHNSDIESAFGNSAEYWHVYNTISNQFEFWTSDSDGSSTDKVVWSVDDGTSQFDVTDNLTVGGSLTMGTGAPLIPPSDGNIYAFQSIWTEGSLISAATPWRAGLWSGNSVVISIEHIAVCNFDLTGGSFENLLTSTTAIFEQVDADENKFILLTSGAHSGGAAEIKTFISTTQVIVETFGWDDDLAGVSFIVTPHPIFVSGSGYKISMYVAGEGNVEIDSDNYTGGNLFEIELTVGADGSVGQKIEMDGGGYSDLIGLLAEYETGDLQPGDHSIIICVDINETGAVSSNSTTEIDFIQLVTTDTNDLVKHAIHVGQGFDDAFTVSGGTEEDPDYGYEDTLTVVADRVTGTPTDGTAFLEASASDLAIFDNDNDNILIGNTATFEAIEAILVTGANQPILAQYDYSSGNGTWSSLTVTQTTNDFKQSGVVSFTAPISWALTSLDSPGGTAINTGYYVRITRTRNNLGAPPVEDYFKTYTSSSLTDLVIRGDGTIRPVHVADGAAPNDSVYYSITQNKLVYKDSGGVVNDLY